MSLWLSTKSCCYKWNPQCEGCIAFYNIIYTGVLFLVPTLYNIASCHVIAYTMTLLTITILVHDHKYAWHQSEARVLHYTLNNKNMMVRALKAVTLDSFVSYKTAVLGQYH